MNSPLIHHVGDCDALIDSVLAHHPFFDCMSESHLRKLRPLARLRDFAPYHVIFETEEEADDFHILLNGEVALETAFLPGRGLVRIETLVAGDILGCSWIFRASGRQYGARAISPTTTVSFEIAALRRVIAADHEMGYELSLRIGQVLLHRLNRTRQGLQSASEHH